MQNAENLKKFIVFDRFFDYNNNFELKDEQKKMGRLAHSPGLQQERANRAAQIIPLRHPVEASLRESCFKWI